MPEEAVEGAARRWQSALAQFPTIRTLAERSSGTRDEVEAAARLLGVSTATLYRLLRRYRKVGTVDGLVVQTRGWRPGRGRLSGAAEQLIDDAIRQFYLQQPAPSIAALHREIALRCRRDGFPVPARSTIARRISRLSQRQLRRRRDGPEAAEQSTMRPGAYRVNKPNAVWQIDHSPADLIIVDSLSRQPIGRPWLTFVVDVASRFVPGLHVSLEAPSVVSVGMALRHAILPKAAALAERGIFADWPAGGLPDAIHSDNGSDFRSSAFARACANLGLETIARPVRQPRYGGHIERLIGTAQSALHLLPGTTFSNVAARGSYDSDARAAMTLDEFETWLWRFIAADYNMRIHSAIKMPPLAAWQAAKGWEPRQPQDPDALALEFLPSIMRTIGRQGIMFCGIGYYEPFLETLFERGARRVQVHYDPRDMARVFLRTREGFQTIRYRNLANPPLSLWEVRAARKALVDEGRTIVNEAALMEARMRNAELVETSARLTRRQRRERERRDRGLSPVPTTARLPSAPKPMLQPDDETGMIELW